MSATYRAINWNAHKKRYDLAIGAFVVVFVAAFAIAGSLLFRGDEALSPPVLAMRALGVCAVVMLHIVLAVGPLSRLTTLAAPLLYNRRHLGVATFLVALAHATVATMYYGAFGGRNPLIVLLTLSGDGLSAGAFPFVIPGVAALIVLFLMAATSHDFWLATLSAWWWKWLHMLVYGAYLCVVAHVSLGVMQSERSAAYPLLLIAGAAALGGLHVVAGIREWERDSRISGTDGLWADAGPLSEIPMDRAVAVRTKGCAPIAVYRHDQGVSAIGGVCAHQGGPLGEGKIVDGCVTCPWHGYQYRPGDGCSPPPYHEKLVTHLVRIEHGRVMVRLRCEAPGTRLEPARVESGGER